MTNIFLGEPPANVKQWIIDSRSVTATIHDQIAGDMPVKVIYDDSELTGEKLRFIDSRLGSGNMSGIDKIPMHVTSIGTNAFKNYSLLGRVAIPSSVTSIGDSAFDGCRSLTSMIIPSSVTDLGYRAFFECMELSSVSILANISEIKMATFHSSGLTSVTIPSSVTTIQDYAFYNCNSLSSVAIPDSVTSIWESAFDGCPNLNKLTIPASVTSMGRRVISAYHNSELELTLQGKTKAAAYQLFQAGSIGGSHLATAIVICSDGKFKATFSETTSSWSFEDIA